MKEPGADPEKTTDEQKKINDAKKQDSGVVSVLKRKQTKIGENDEGEEKELNYEICYVNKDKAISKIEDTGHHKQK